MSTMPTEVTICGAGNVSQYLLCSLTQVPGMKVNIFAPYKDHGAKLRRVWADFAPDETLWMEGAMGTKHANLAQVHVTEDPVQAFRPEVQYIILSLPAYANQGYLDVICRYASKGSVILGMPGFGGFEWGVSSACAKASRSMSDFIVAVTQECPLSCRWTDFGKKVFVRGKKENGIIAGCLPQGQESAICRWVEAACCNEIKVREAPYLQVVLSGSIFIAHGFPLAEVCRKNDEGHEMVKGELLWYGHQERCASMDAADLEWQQVVFKVSECYQACKGKPLSPPMLPELIDFAEMWRQFYPEQKAQQTLAGVMSHNSAYRWTTVPQKELVLDGRTQYVPDYADRKFAQDLPFGLCMVKILASKVDVPTPVFDDCIQYLQKKMGKDYLRYHDHGVEPGKDLVSEAELVMLLNGKGSVQQFLNFY